MPGLAALTLHLLAFQDPLHTSSLPVQAGVTMVQVVSGDAYQARDYETVIAIESATGGNVTLGSTAFVKDRAGVRRWLAVRRTVLADDLRGARTLILGYDTDDAERFPGTTSVGPSRILIDELRRTGHATVTVRNYASRPDNTGAIRLVERRPVAFPILLNGLRTFVPAFHARGELRGASGTRSWEFWFLDHPVQPLTVKVMFGDSGRPAIQHPAWSRQITRIDVPGDLAPMAAGNAELGGEPGTASLGAGAPGANLGDGAAGSSDGTGGGRRVSGGGTGGGGAGAARLGEGMPDGVGDGRVGVGRGGQPSGSATGSGSSAGLGIEGRLATLCRVTVPGVYFEFDSDLLNPASTPWIRSIADLLRRHPDWTITIEGHTDSIGGARYNHDLSVRRSVALKRALTGEHAIPAARLSTAGFGPDRPLESNATPEGRARNRRVELVRPCDRKS
jgi:outer membrane protein OmpA-like peptidoglycan-associated protein